MKCLAVFNFIYFGCAQFKALFHNLFRKRDEKETFIYRLPTKVIKTTGEKIVLMHNGLPQFLYEKMKQYREKESLIFAPTGETILTSLLLSESLNIAKFLTNHKIKAGNVILIYSENNLQVPAAFLGIIFSAAIVASIDPAMESGDILHLLKLLKPRMVFISAAQKEGMQNLRVQLKIIFDVFILEDIVKFTTAGVVGNFVPGIPNSLDSVAFVVFSSGTTGVPKAVNVSHKFAIYNANRSEISTYVDFSPLCLHFSALLFLSSIAFGATRVIIPTFSPKHFWKFIDTYKVTYLYLNYIELHSLMELKPKLKHLPEYITIHGDIMTENDLIQIDNLLPKIQIIYEYDKAELGAAFRCNYRENILKRLTVGVPKPGFEYKIVDLDHHINLGVNQKGELRVKTEYSFSGYHNEKWTSKWDDQGFLKTGDVAYYDNDFCFYIVDRVEYTFKSKGKRVFPGVLESITRSHPDIDIASVIGIPGAMSLNHPIAVVVPKKSSGVTSRKILKFINKAVGEHEKLTAALIVDSLPLTFSRKLNHRNVYAHQTVK